jgi:hypothetical protein
MNATVFDQLQSALQQQGPLAAIDQLCQRLREDREYHALFYALLLRKRHELGVNPVPTGPADELPAELHDPYEEGIRQAAREVGALLLQAGNLPHAWHYFRMIGENAPVKAALDKYEPGDDEDIQPLVQIAYYEGVHPTRGFDWILSRYGLCNAITTVSSSDLSHPKEARDYCIRALVRTLYHDLRHRLAAEIQARWNTPAPGADAPPDTPGIVRQLIQDRDWLFADDAYHVDTSHLSSVVQLSATLDPCLELSMARELCAYGAKLSRRFGTPDDPPFENGYRDLDIYLGILNGEDIEAGLAHFRAKIESYDLQEIGTYPVEVLVNLLLRLNRGPEALELARKYLVGAERQGRQLTCPNLNELCQRLKAYDTLAEVARELNDPVYYLAGLLAARQAASGVTGSVAQPEK